jgi:hypothetical protein
MSSLNTSAHSGFIDIQNDMQKAQIDSLRFRSHSTLAPMTDLSPMHFMHGEVNHFL